MTEESSRPVASWDVDGRRVLTWLTGLAVAVGAIVATAHGLHQVAASAGVPNELAWLYPLITDGLALVAYAATGRLTGGAQAYAWVVVVLAAGLSGLAQAVYLASGTVAESLPALRMGVGAWPAVAAAIVLHLLFLLAEESSKPIPELVNPARELAAVELPEPASVPAGTGPENRPSSEVRNRPPTPSSDPVPTASSDPSSRAGTGSGTEAGTENPTTGTGLVLLPGTGADQAQNRELAVLFAREFRAEHGSDPTVDAFQNQFRCARKRAGELRRDALAELAAEPGSEGSGTGRELVSSSTVPAAGSGR